jgi:hypothetical protein
MNNLEIWNAMKQPPKEALKAIGGGRLKGMTDIKPQWRYLAMTERFGPIGIGWKYTIDRLWTEPGAVGEVLAFALITLYIKPDQWSDGIPGIGGSTIIDKEKEGLHSSDEGYKMAVTDALSVAMKTLGVAADVYMGSWNGSKYRDEVAPRGLPPEDAGLANVKDSKGNLSPPRDPGPEKPSGDGTRGALLEWRKKINNITNAGFPGTDPKEYVLTADEIQDITAELNPGGRKLEPTDADIDIIKNAAEKYGEIVDHRLDVYSNGDSSGE